MSIVDALYACPDIISAVACGGEGRQHGHVCRHVAASRALLGRGYYSVVD